MPIRFLDEPVVIPKRKIRFLDEEPTVTPKRRIRFLDEPTIPQVGLQLEELPQHVIERKEREELGLFRRPPERIPLDEIRDIEPEITPP